MNGEGSMVAPSHQKGCISPASKPWEWTPWVRRTSKMRSARTRCTWERSGNFQARGERFRLSNTKKTPHPSSSSSSSSHRHNEVSGFEWFGGILRIHGFDGVGEFIGSGFFGVAGFLGDLEAVTIHFHKQFFFWDVGKWLWMLFKPSWGIQHTWESTKFR